MRRFHPHHRLFLRLLLGVVLANYLAQIPYYLHLYYFPHNALPSLSGTLLLSLTLAWFLLGYVGVARGWSIGYWLLVSFLVTEVGFYLMNMVRQVTHGYPPFLHLQTRDPVLFVVFAIGYLNLLAGIVALYYLLRHWRAFIAHGDSAAARGGAS